MRKKRLLFLLVLALQFSGFSQGTIQIKGKKIQFDSLFIDYYYAYRFKDDLPNTVTYKKNTRESIAYNFIKAVQLREQEKYTMSNRLINKQFTYSGPRKTLAHVGLHYLKGLNLYDLYQDDDALKELLKADSLAIEYKDAFLILFIKDFRANIYQDLGNNRQSKKILESGLPFLSECTSDWMKTRYLKSYSATLNQLAVSEKNNHYARRALQLIDSLLVNTRNPAMSDLNAALLSELGFSHSILGNHQSAIQHYNEAIAIVKNQFPQQYNNLLITLFHEYYSIGDYRKVIVTGEDILSWIDSFDALANRKKEIHQVLANVYEKTGNYKKALHHTHKLLQEVERQHALRYSKELAELEEKYESTKKEQEIARGNAERKSLNLEKESLENDRNVRKKQLGYLVVVLIIIGVLLLIAILSSVRFSLAKKRIEVQSNELTNNNLQLAELIHDKEFLFKELHHRVKNNFQLLVGFLLLQEKYAGNQSIEHFIRQSEMKLNAMAMVHEMLYREQTNELVDIRQYLYNLGESIIATASVIDVEFFCEGDTAFLPIDKAIPIGLTTNEIIFNSLKHAGQEELSIRIVTTKTDDRLSIKISDDGDGFPVDFNPATSNSLGVKAIQLLMEQIGGTSEWKIKKGAQWILTIPNQEISQKQ
jgi:two-component sensor histidine kinase/tetratricopeptide (TPR) repeat protein